MCRTPIFPEEKQKKKVLKFGYKGGGYFFFFCPFFLQWPRSLSRASDTPVCVPRGRSRFSSSYTRCFLILRRVNPQQHWSWLAARCAKNKLPDARVFWSVRGVRSHSCASVSNHCVMMRLGLWWVWWDSNPRPPPPKKTWCADDAIC